MHDGLNLNLNLNLHLYLNFELIFFRGGRGGLRFEDFGGVERKGLS